MCLVLYGARIGQYEVVFHKYLGVEEVPERPYNTTVVFGNEKELGSRFFVHVT